MCRNFSSDTWSEVLPYLLHFLCCQIVSCKSGLCVDVLLIIHQNAHWVPKGPILSVMEKYTHFCPTVQVGNLTCQQCCCSSTANVCTCFSCMYSLPTLGNYKGWGANSSDCWVMLPFNWSLPLNKGHRSESQRNWDRLTRSKGGCDGSEQKEESGSALLFCWSRRVSLRSGHEK